MKNKKKSKIRTALFAVSLTLFTEVMAQSGVTGPVDTEAAALTENLLSGSTVWNLMQFEQSYEEKLKEAEEKKKELEQKKAEIDKQIQENNSKKEDLLAYIESLDMQIIELNEEIDGLNADIAAAETELEETRAALALAQETEAAQYEAMKRRIQYMYENGESSTLELLLGATSLSDLLNRMEYQKKITEYDENLLASYTAAKLEVENQKKLLEVELENLQTLKETAEFNRATLEQLAADKSAEVEAYAARLEIDTELFYDYAEQITAADADIESIKEEERKRIEEEERRRKEEEAKKAAEEEERRKKAEEAKKAAEAAQKAAESESDAKRLKAIENVTPKDETDPDKMIWPLPGDGRIYAYFGYRVAPTAGASTYHRGLDIGGVYGASIVASLSGKVIESTYNASRGYYVAIDHGNGLVTYYMHCSKLIAKVGDKVLQGEVIALVGSTGISTGPHVHFSVTENGNYVDPLKYVSYNE